MWRDETATREFAMLSFKDLAHAVSHVDLVMAPYYALMHVVASISPHTSALRLPSAIASVLTVLFVSAAVRSRWGSLAALVTGSFLAFNATFLATATTARAYALAAMFLAGALWVSAAKIRPRLAAPLWVLACCAACLMQLFSVLLIPALVIALGARMGWRKACAWAVIPLVCAVSILAITHKQSSQVGWIARISFGHALRECGETLAGRVVWPLVVLIAVGAVVGVARRTLDTLWIALLVATILPPLALWAASAVTNPVFLMRYAVFFVPAFAGLLGASVGMLLQPVSPLVLRGCATVVVLAGILGNSYSDLHNLLRLRAGADSTATLSVNLARHVHAGDVIIYESSHAAGGQIYGWALYGHDTALVQDLLTELPQGKGAMLQQRKVVSVHPLKTVATLNLAPTTWIVSSSGEAGPRPDLHGCSRVAQSKIDRVPVTHMTCAQ